MRAATERARMTTAKPPLTGTTYLKHIADRLNRATGMARAAEACARSGDDEGAAKMMTDIDIPVYEAKTLISAAYLLNRIERDQRAAPSGHRPKRRKARKG